MKVSLAIKSTVVFICLIKVLVVSSIAVADDMKISKDEAWKKIRSGALLVDVRSPEEYQTHVEGAVNIPYDNVKERLAEFGEDKNREIVLYCKSGRRAGIAKTVLTGNGYTHVFNAGGYSDLE